jgi:transcriptional regulator with XRE-family HTH domain
MGLCFQRCQAEGKQGLFCPADGGEGLISQNLVKSFCLSYFRLSLPNCQESLYSFFMPRPPKNTPKPLPQIEVPIGKRIAYYRKLRGFSQEALAEKMGISQRQVATYENGRAHLNDEMIIRFALTLRVPADELLGLKPFHKGDNAPTLRYTRRLHELMQLPDAKKRVVLKVLDDLIRANT